MTKDAVTAENVWGDIYRNRFLATLRDPPMELTPDYGKDIHPAIKLDQLQKSRIWASMMNCRKRINPSNEMSIGASLDDNESLSMRNEMSLLGAESS